MHSNVTQEYMIYKMFNIVLFRSLDTNWYFRVRMHCYDISTSSDFGHHKKC